MDGQFIFESWLTQIAWLVLYLAVARGMLLLFDRRNDIDFRGWWSDASSTDRALYLGARLVAVFIGAALVVRPPL